MIHLNDKRTRYAPELGVWAVDTGQHHAGGAEQILGVMMHYAREAGEVPDGCTCFPEVSSNQGPLGGGVHTSGPRVHVGPVSRPGRLRARQRAHGGGRRGLGGDQPLHLSTG